MFGIGGWEFILIAVLALLLFGPDKLPQFARTVGRFMRDFKRYQDLMESTIRAEMFAADPTLRKDAFQNAKEFRKKMASGGFSKAETSEESPTEEDAVDEAAEEEPIDIITGKPGPPPNEEPDVEPGTDSDVAGESEPDEFAETQAPAEGEGEREGV